jgi:predicted secreted protein
MSLTTFIAIYFVLWWVVLLAVLPWGSRSQEESGEVVPGTDPGAPAVHRVWRKLLITTLTTTVVVGIFYALYRYGLIPFGFLERISMPPHS